MRAVHLISNLCLIVSAQSDTARPRFASTRPQNLDPSHAGSAVQGFADLPQLIIFVPCHPRLHMYEVPGITSPSCQGFSLPVFHICWISRSLVQVVDFPQCCDSSRAFVIERQ
jgi:hypothetical protein